MTTVYMYFVRQKPYPESIGEIIALSLSCQHLRQSTEASHAAEGLPRTTAKSS